MRWTVHGERTIYESEWLCLALTDVEVPGGERFDHHVVRMPDKAAGTVVHDPARPGYGRRALAHSRAVRVHPRLPGLTNFAVLALRRGNRPPASAHQRVARPKGAVCRPRRSSGILRRVFRASFRLTESLREAG